MPSNSRSQRKQRSPLEFSDDEEEYGGGGGGEAGMSGSSRRSGGGRRGGGASSRSPSRYNGGGDDSDGDGYGPSRFGGGGHGDEDESESEHGVAGPYGGGGGGPSYLPTAYGGGPADPTAGLGRPNRERSVDRIRSRDRRRDISKDRGARGGSQVSRDRSRSESQSRRRGGGGGAAATSEKEKAAERRRNRRASLEDSLRMNMGMDDSVSSFNDLGSVHSTASNALDGSFRTGVGVMGMDSSYSGNHQAPSARRGDRDRAPGERRFRRTQSRDATSTDDVERNATQRRAMRRTQSRDAPTTDFTQDRGSRGGGGSGNRGPPLKSVKTWDGRIDDVLNKRRARKK